MRGVVLLLAAGEGVRLDNGTPKAFVELCGVPLVSRAAEAASAAELVDAIIAAVPQGLESEARGLLSAIAKPVTVVTGGATRQASAAAALGAAGEPEAVAVHDAARPLCPPSLFDACLRELDRCDAVCPATPPTDTMKELERDVVRATLDRSRLAAAQTPQTFRTAVYRRAHEAAARDGVTSTDDAALAERIGVSVRIVPGDARNMKITTALDLVVAEAVLRTS